MLKKLLLIGATAALAASQAIAADITDEPVVFDWSGPYVGLTAGWAWTKADGSVSAPIENLNDEAAAVIENFWDDDIKADGFTGGATLGFNHQMGSLVLGVEGDLSFLDHDETRDSEALLQGQPITLLGHEKLEADLFATLRLRAGLALDQTLVFVTGGAAYTDAKVKRELQWDFGDGCPASGGGFEICHKGDAEFDWGWTIGAGVEHAFDDNWSVKLEYLYADFGNQDFNTTNPTFPPQVFGHSFDLDMHIVRAGLNLRFNP